MTGYLLTYLIIVPSGLLCLFPMRNQMKYGLARTVGGMGILFASVIPLAAALARSLSLKPNTPMLVLLPLLFLVYHRCLCVHRSKSLAVYCAVIALMSILGNFAAVFDAARNPALGADSYTPEYGLVHLLLGFAAAVFLFYPFWKYGSRLIDRLELYTVWYLTIPFSGLILAICLFLRPEKYETYFVNRVTRSVQLILTALLFTWVLLLVVFYFIVEELQNAEADRERVRFLEMQESQYLAQQRYIEASARTRHDSRQAVRTIRGLIQAKDWDALEDFIDRYEESLPENEMALYTGNHSLNALLNYYAQRARENGIRVEFRIALPELFRVSDVELCGMVGNILENAVAACPDIPESERMIQLVARVQHHMTFILVATNTFNGSVRLKNGQYLSTRRRGRGVGLSSIRSTAEKYGGIAEFSHDEKKFYSNIMIPVFENGGSGRTPV